MTLQQPDDQQFAVASQRHEVMFKDGTAVTLHPVFEGGIPCQYLRAVRLPKGVTVVFDVRRFSRRLGSEICMAASRDVHGLIWGTLRGKFTSAKPFVAEVSLCGSVLREERVAA